MKIDEKIEKFLNEVSSPGRAWSGKIKHIDSLLAWMYEKNILTKGEKAEKDRIFRQYYRYYNDGDLPGAMRKAGHSLQRIGKYSRNMNKEGEAELEKYLEAFIKKILSKYMPKIDRTAFRIEKSIKDLSDIKHMIDDGTSINSVINYWLKKVKITDEGEETKFTELLSQAEQFLNILNEAAKNSVTGNINQHINYVRDAMKEKGTWTNDMERYWIELMHIMGKIGNFIGNLIIGFEKAAALRTLG